MTAQEWLDAVSTSRRALVPISDIREPLSLATWVNYDSPGTGYSTTWRSQTHYGQPRSAYRSITGVQVNTGGLTYEPNSVLVTATLDSWYWDPATSVLYVNAGANPTSFSWIGAIFEMYFSNDPLADALALWEPRVVGALPTITAEETDITLGLTTSMSGVLQLNNADGFFDDLAVKYRWHNAKVSVLVGGADLAVADYYTAAALQITGQPAAGDEICAFQLRDFDNQVRNRAFPLHIYDDFFTVPDFTLMPPELHGQYLPMVWGTVYDIPVTYIRANGLFDRHLIIDPIQASSGVTVTAVRATSRTTGATVTLDETTDYVSASYYVEIRRSLYAATDYTFTVDCSRSTTITAGALAADLLDLIGVPAVEIDTATFADADTDWPAELGLYVAGGPAPEVFVSCGELIRQIETSSLGRVTFSAEGLWSMSIYDPAVPVDAPILPEELISHWQPTSDIQEPMALTMRVQYAKHITSGRSSSTSATQRPLAYGYQAVDSISVPTLLVEATDAALLAARLAWINSAPTNRIEIDGPPALFPLMPRDKVRVQRSRFPSSTGTAAYPGVGMEIERIAKRPSDCRAAVTVGNMRGTGETVKTAAPDGTADWDTASALERAAYGFGEDDATERVDTADATTYHQAEAW